MPKRKQPVKTKKPRQKQKQKQIVKQNVKVNVQSSGGSGGLGGSGIPTQPQYIPQYIPQSIPNNFRDTRGEDVILQRLSEIADKFNAKPQPTEALSKIAPLPTEYIDSVVNAEVETPPKVEDSQLVTKKIFRSKPTENTNLLSELPFNEDPMGEFFKPSVASKKNQPKVLDIDTDIVPYGQVTKVSKIEDLTEKAKKRREYYENFEKKAKAVKDKNEARRKQEAMTKMKDAYFNKAPALLPIADKANPESVVEKPKRKIIKPKKYEL